MKLLFRNLSLCLLLLLSLLICTASMAKGASKSKDRSQSSSNPPPSSSSSSSTLRSTFKICDSDSNWQLTRSELTVCMTRFREASHELGGNLVGGPGDDVIFDLMDANKDNAIQLTEYLEVYSKVTSKMNSKSNFGDDVMNEDYKKHDSWDKGNGGGSSSSRSDRVHLKNRFGQVENISRDEMTKRSAKVAEGLQQKDGKLFKQNQGQFNISNITDPSIKRFVTIGQFSLHELKRQGLTNGSLANLESLPFGGVPSLSSSAQGLSETVFDKQRFDIWLVLTLKTIDAVENKRLFELIEVRVAYDKVLYPMPHLALLEAWRLKTDKTSSNSNTNGNSNSNNSSDNSNNNSNKKNYYRDKHPLSLQPPVIRTDIRQLGVNAIRWGAGAMLVVVLFLLYRRLQEGTTTITSATTTITKTMRRIDNNEKEHES